MHARILVLLSALLAGACAAYDGPARVSGEGPDRATFALPSEVLVERCGSLDCHGSVYRNYRLYGFGGTRLDRSHFPDGPPTTRAEIDADYDATVSLEPDLSLRVASGAAPVSSLTLLRKADGSEKHVGGVRLPQGDPAHTCIATWLARGTADEACRRALAP